MNEMIRILLVDDSEAVHRVVGSCLSAAGFHVVGARGVREALRRVRGAMPDLVLSDFNMPGLSGEALVRLLRRDARLSQVPVIMLSSETDPVVRGRVLALGADAWLDKPIEPAVLLSAIARVCDNGFRLRRRHASIHRTNRAA